MNFTPTRTVHITAPSRLHFGLFSFGDAGRRQFGGVGVMVDQPAVTLTVEPAERFSARGPLATRVCKFARRWSEFYELTDVPNCRIAVRRTAPQHVGLGVGTQLGLSVAWGLHAACGRQLPPPDELAASVGRGLRSAVGTYGFCHGGLIVERGKLRGETLAPLDGRVELPEQWRFVLVRPSAGEGLYGKREQVAFSRLPAVPARISDQLIQEVRQQLVPAALAGDFDSFSRSLYRYGRTAGMCFARQQNGSPFNGPQLTRLVETIRDLGIEGVGQSSWGPTLFAVLANRAQASEFVRGLRSVIAGNQLHAVTTRTDKSGAKLTVVNEPVVFAHFDV